MNTLIKKLRLAIKENTLMYSLHTRLLSKDYKAQRKRMKLSTAKPKEQIKREMKMYADYWGVPANEYVRYGLFEKCLTDEEILDYIPSQFFYCKYLKDAYSDLTEDDSVYDDKFNQFGILRSHDIATPDVHYIIKGGKLLNLNGKTEDASVLLSLAHEGEKIFIKPTDGRGGSGIIVLTRNRGGYNGLNNNDLENLRIDKSRTYIVQKGLTQNPEIAKIYAGSLNTLRTIVQYRNGKVNIVGCILRMGRNGAEVDNSAQGGISIKVNFDDGTFAPPAQAEHGGGTFYSHPDTGYDFMKNRIIGWDQIKTEIIATVSKMTDFGDVGWDIALTDTGVSVIEFNLGYGIVHAQLSCGGLRRILNAYPK